MYTKQQGFDIIAAHLLTQGQKATTNGTGVAYCAYRGKNDTKCAIGVLIPDCLYSFALEGKTLDKFHPEFIQQLGIPIEDIPFYARLQSIHDRESPAQWKDSLIFFAHRFGMDESICHTTIPGMVKEREIFHFWSGMQSILLRLHLPPLVLHLPPLVLRLKNLHLQWSKRSLW